MKKIIITCFIIYFLVIPKTFALIEIDITRGNLDPLPIAVSPFMLILNLKNYKDLK